MKRYTLISLALLFLAIFAGTVFEQGDVAQAKQNSTASCVSMSCHSTMGKDSYVHGPIAVGECTMCHISTDWHKFTRLENIASACYKCHDKVDTTKGVHKSAKEGNCTKCHNAHQSPHKFLLLGDQMLAGTYKSTN
ncbi:MAG TPA: cytochrome c3 family protein [Thermodesulfovibrionales bacterium]|nr:cytochrome c3 family protein [Thermodesulfovibrionales bacterium]